MMAQQAYLPLLPPVQFTPNDMAGLQVQQFTQDHSQFDYRNFHQGMAHAYAHHAYAHHASQPQSHPAWTQQPLKPLKPLHHEDERLRKLEKRKESNRLSAKRSKMKQKAKLDEVVSTAVACHDQNTIIRAQIRDYYHALKKINDDNNQLRKELNQPVSNDIPKEPNLPPQVLLPDRIIYQMDKAKENDFIQEVLLTPPSKCIEQLETEFKIRHLTGFEHKN